MAGWWQLGLLIALLSPIYRPLGDYMAWVFSSEKSLRVERARSIGWQASIHGRATVVRDYMRVAAGVLGAFGALRLHLPTGANRCRFRQVPGLEASARPSTRPFHSPRTRTGRRIPGESTMGHLTQMSTGRAGLRFRRGGVDGGHRALIRGFTLETRRPSATSGPISRAGSFGSCCRSRSCSPSCCGLAGAPSRTSQLPERDPPSQADPSDPRRSPPRNPSRELGTNGGGFWHVTRPIRSGA